MIQDAISAVVRIIAPNGQIAGTGFLAGKGPWVITCTHVIEKADPNHRGGLKVELLSGGEPLNCSVIPAYSRASSKEDVTFLRLDISMEERKGLPRVSLGTSFKFKDVKLGTFGFPPIRGGEGAHGACEAIGHVPEGGFDALQLRAPEITYGFSGAPVWNEATQLVVGMVVSIIPPSEPGGRMQETSFIRAIEVIRTIANTPPPPGSDSEKDGVSLALLPGTPYRGLEVFSASDKDLYFGRDEIIKELVTRLDRDGIIVVTGVSGSGKSSLLRAGLAKGLEQWTFPSLLGRKSIISVPTSRPSFSLLNDIEDPPGVKGDGQRAAEISDAECTSSHLMAAITRQAGASQTILIIDQLERLFTDCPSPDVRRRYLEFLHTASESGIKVLIGVRIDFLDLVEQDPFLGRSLAGALVIQQMSEKELAEAIEKPAENLGRVVEAATTRALIADVRERPGDLPLLEFALTELWNADNALGVLTFNSYNALGYETPAQKVTGAQGAIIKRAEEEWGKLEDKSGKKLAINDFQRLFLKLVQVSVVTGRLTRPSSRRAWLAEFDDDSEANAEVLTNSFLLTRGLDPNGQPTVEVVHEALIRQWTHLESLIEPNANFLNWYANQFSRPFQNWTASKRPRSSLLAGDELETALEWSKRKPELLVGPTANFIAASKGRRLKKRVGVAALGIVLLFGLSIGFIVWGRAKLAHAKELHESGVVSIDERSYNSAQIQLATSLALSDDTEARQHLLLARENGMQLHNEGVVNGDPITSSGSGTRLVAVRRDNRVFVQNTETGSQWDTALRNSESSRFAVNNDGTALAYSDHAGGLRILKVDQDGKNPTTIAVGSASDPGIDSLAFSQDGRQLAVGRMNGQVELRKADDGSLQKAVQAHRLAVHVVRFLPGGTAILSGGADRTVQLWICKQDKPTKIGEHENFVSSLATSPSGDRAASGGADGAVRVWQLNATALGQSSPQGAGPNDPRLLSTFTGHTGTVMSVALGDHGLVVSGGEDGTVRLWDTTVNSEMAQFDAGGTVRIVAIGSDGDVTAIGNNDIESFVRVWNVGAGQEGVTLYHSGPVATVAITDDGKEIAAGGQDGKISVWSLDEGQYKALATPLAVPSTAHAVWSLAFTPDGQLISGGEDGILRLWNLSTRTVRELPLRGGPHTPQTSEPADCPEMGGDDSSSVWSIAVHPSGLVAAVGAADDEKSCIYLVDIARWTELTRIKHQFASVWSLAFSPKGNLLAAGAGDSQVRLWDTSDLYHPKLLDAKIDVGREVWGVPFTPDGRSLVTAGLDRHVRLWDVSDLAHVKPQYSYGGKFDHQGLVQSAAVSPKGEWVATASVDRTVKLWNIQTHEVLTLGGHDRPAWWVVFSRDGKRVISGGLDRRVVVRDFDRAQQVLNEPVDALLNEAKEQTCLQMNAADKVIYGDCKGKRREAGKFSFNVANR